MNQNIPALLSKYNREIPRYTSYPTVPHWQKFENNTAYQENFQNRFGQYNREEGIALYLHLPFCETLCTYCGCNKIITTNHSVEDDYLNTIIEEWYHYRKLMDETPIIRELHLGGGTPTFFSAENLRRLLNCLFDLADLHDNRLFSIEGHPNNTTKAHLALLSQFGFRRISLGVQDHNPEVQRIINRIQPYENVQKVTAWARDAGFTSINYDLIYGLPRQTEKSMEKTIRDTIALRPDRIAFYSYAHVPWKAKSQRLYDEKDLPSDEKKIRFYLLAREMFQTAGYLDIGMDHFALPGDELYKAFLAGDVHRNFMGYTTVKTHLLVGLGISAISDTGMAYSQNTKKLSDYYRMVKKGDLPVQKGWLLSETDRICREYIMNIACKGTTAIQMEHRPLLEQFTFPRLKTMEADGLVTLSPKRLQATPTGRLFLRNICHAFDLKSNANLTKENPNQFSKAI